MSHTVFLFLPTDIHNFSFDKILFKAFTKLLLEFFNYSSIINYKKREKVIFINLLIYKIFSKQIGFIYYNNILHQCYLAI